MTKAHLFLFVAILTALNGCSVLSSDTGGAGSMTMSSAPAMAMPAPPMPTSISLPPKASDFDVSKNFAVVRGFFATDRSLTGKVGIAEKFGDYPSTLSYGICDVSIPREHRMGALESPSILKFEFREDPAKHVMLLDATLQSKDVYFAGVAEQVRASARDSAFVFVHGYNVSFLDASRRTAQMSYDLGFDGAPVFYSWPSKGQAPCHPARQPTNHQHPARHAAGKPRINPAIFTAAL